MFSILVVDDDKNTRLFMKSFLEAEKYQVHLAKNGEEALEVMDRQHVDLVILDIMMPKMDGYEFTKTLRDVNSDLPILMVSARQLPEDRKKGYRLGSNDFMVKPVDEEELLLRMQNLLRLSKIGSERKLQAGEVVLDYDALRVEYRGEKQTLPQKEFQLLFKLLSNPGRIFTRIELMDEIWGAESESSWETVTVHIARLRRKFEKWDAFSIVSVRGLGYKAVRKE